MHHNKENHGKQKWYMLNKMDIYIYIERIQLCMRKRDLEECKSVKLNCGNMAPESNMIVPVWLSYMHNIFNIFIMAQSLYLYKYWLQPKMLIIV